MKKFFLLLTTLIGLSAFAATYTTMYPPAGGPYKYQTVVIGQSGNTYNPTLAASQSVLDADVPALLADGWTMISPASSSTQFASSITDTLSSSQDNYKPTGLSGQTNRLRTLAASGGSTVSGLDATGVVDGTTRLWVNTSSTDAITFLNLSANSQATNRFACPYGMSAILAPGDSVFLIYVVNQWVFE